jgi:ABC-type polysaccharide/polyol phosphate transport system ATPase subunit
MSTNSRNMPKRDTVVQTRQVSKTFPRETSRATAYRTLQKQLLRRSQQAGAFVALEDINLEVFRGEKIGIIGDNGSGKTTLLKVVAGLYKPDGGQVYVKGEMTLLAGLGIGMIDELSVEENVFLYGAIYGLERIKLQDNLHEIIEWAQLQEFVGAKLKTLSSGMRTRLAFSAARYIEKDIYLLDEALTAGDTHFQQKCAAVFESYKATDKTFLITTHDLGFVKTFCSKTLWLHKGRQVEFGETEDVLEQYQESNRE